MNQYEFKAWTDGLTEDEMYLLDYSIQNVLLNKNPGLDMFREAVHSVFVYRMTEAIKHGSIEAFIKAEGYNSAEDI